MGRLQARSEETLQFGRVRRPSLVEMVAADLREAILSGRLRPGERVSDLKVAGEMGISRAPVREALHQLAARGLLVEEPRRGMFVTRLSRSSARHVYDCRRALEGLAAQRIAVAPGLREAVGRLRQIVGEMDAASRYGDPLATAEVDHRFHTTLCDLTGNTWLIRLYQQLADQSRLMQALDSVAHADSDKRELVMRHEPIVTAIATGDPGRAEQAVVAHIDLSERLFLDEVPDVAED
jgi:DNA-binding GntR family transcriptional regulator